MSEDHRDLDRASQEAVDRYRREKLISLVEVLLGDLVALDGIEPTKAVLQKFKDQLDLY